MKQKLFISIIIYFCVLVHRLALIPHFW